MQLTEMKDDELLKLVALDLARGDEGGMTMSFYEWRPYVPVAERRRKAQRELAKLKKKGQTDRAGGDRGPHHRHDLLGQGVVRQPRALQRLREPAAARPHLRPQRLGRRPADRQGQGDGDGQRLRALPRQDRASRRSRKPHWKAICRDCAGPIDSLVELLQGRLAKGVMDRVCREGDGLFPAPKEIKLSCSCPDWADMCKHVAAVLYGVGARLDQAPELLFVLRGVDQNELIAGAGQDLSATTAKPTSAKVLADGDVAALFGLEMADVAPAAPQAPRETARIAKGSKRSAPKRTTRKKVSATKAGPPRGTRNAAKRKNA